MIVCGTGHRPDKLGGYTDDVFEDLVWEATEWLKANQPRLVISGGALGWDQALAQAAIDLGIELTLALPFPGFEDRWPQASKNKLYGMMNQANVHYVCAEGYAGWKMQERNKWMVDHADVVLALWNGTPGGTSNCVKYAESKKKPIVNLWESYANHAISQLP